MYSRPVRVVLNQWFVAVCLCLGLGSLAAGNAWSEALARPANPAAATCLLKGNRLYAAREFSQAIEQYKECILIEDAHVFQYNLAQAYRALGRHEEALWHYERFLYGSKPDAELRQLIEGFMAELRGEIEKKRVQRSFGEEHEKKVLSKSQIHMSHRSHWYQDTLGWSLSSAGALLVSVGIYLLVDARRIDTLANQESRDVERASLRNRASSRRLSGYVLSGAGLGAMGSGALRLYSHDGQLSSVTIAFAGSF